MFILVSSKDSDTTLCIDSHQQSTFTAIAHKWRENLKSKHSSNKIAVCGGASLNSTATMFIKQTQSIITHPLPRPPCTAPKKMFYKCMLTSQHLSIISTNKLTAFIIIISIFFFGDCVSIYQVNGFSICFVQTTDFDLKTGEIKQVS